MKTEASLALLMFWLALADSLKCHNCLNRQGSCLDTDVEVCRPEHDSCFFEIKRFTGLNAETVKQGCGSSNYCRRYPGGYKGFLFRRMQCCSTDLCLPVEYNSSSGGSENGVKCQSCIGSAAECGLNAPTVPCVGNQNRCVQISQQFLPGEQLEPIIKGCGAASIKDIQMVYQIGNDVAYIDQKVCNGLNCNNWTFQEISAGEPNGLRCYTCWETEDGECALNKSQVLDCRGVMDQCVHFMLKENPNVTIQKGCGTKTLCDYQGTDDPLIRPDGFAECCDSSFCNGAGMSKTSFCIPLAPDRLLEMVALSLSLALMAWK